MSAKIKGSILVCLGGASYGIMASLSKRAMGEGFAWNEVVAAQPIGACVLYLCALATAKALGHHFVSIELRSAVRLGAMGACSILTSVLYNASLARIPASMAVVVLFQYTWMGVLFQTIAERRPPSVTQIASAGLAVLGSILASGMLSQTNWTFDPIGIALCFAAALCMAAFMHVSGRVEPDANPLQRGIIACMGATIIGTFVCPSILTGEALQNGLWSYGLALGAAGLFMPILLFGFATPLIPAGTATVLASSELPVGIAAAAVSLGEPIDMPMAIGVIVVLASVFISAASANANADTVS